MAVVADEALRQIHGYAMANRIILTTHAQGRMRSRGVDYDDVRHGLMTAPACVWQDEHQSWCVDTRDRTGDELVVSVILDGADVVVTVC